MLRTVAGSVAAVTGTVADQPAAALGRHVRCLSCRLIHQQKPAIGADDDDGIADPVDDRLEEMPLSKERGARLRDLGDVRVLKFQFNLMDFQVMDHARGVGRVGCLAT